MTLRDSLRPGSVGHKFRRFALHASCAVVLTGVARGLVACDPPSWIFRRSEFSHDPWTGARVAQYARVPPVEPLPDPRLVTSGYRRTRTNLRGPDGSLDTSYNVTSYGNGLGGLDAEWERFHDAWLESFTAGGSYSTQPVGGYPYYGPANSGFGPGPAPYGFPPAGYAPRW
jgi:hypothetical protein